MDVNELLWTCSEAGVKVWVLRGKLEVTGAPEAVARLVPELRERKAALIAALSPLKGEPWPVEAKPGIPLVLDYVGSKPGEGVTITELALGVTMYVCGGTQEVRG